MAKRMVLAQTFTDSTSLFQLKDTTSTAMQLFHVVTIEIDVLLSVHKHKTTSKNTMSRNSNLL